MNSAHGFIQKRKAWSRFREIPEYIQNRVTWDKKRPETIIEELEQKRLLADGQRRKGLSALSKELELERKSTSQVGQTIFEDSSCFAS